MLLCPGTNEKYKHVIPFLHVFLTRDLSRANIYLSKQFVLFLQVAIWIYSVVDAVNENVIVTDLSKAWDKALQLKDRPLAQ